MTEERKVEPSTVETGAEFTAGFDAAREQAEKIVHSSSNLLQAAARIRRMTVDVAQ